MRIDLISILIAGGIAATATFQPAGAPGGLPTGGVVNQPPQCFAVSPESVRCNGDLVTFLLDGSASFDPDNDPLSYLWTTGCPSAVIADPTAAVTTMTVDTAVTCETTCSIRLTVSDGTQPSFCRTFVSFAPLELSFGVAPGLCPNTIVIEGDDDGGGPSAATAALPTSLIGSKAFDPMTIDFGTIRLGRLGDNFLGGSVAPIDFELVDVGAPFEGDLCECNPLAGDGFIDLLVTFDLDQVIDQLGLANEPDGSVVPLEITGLLLDGTLTVGVDCVVIQQGSDAPSCPEGVSFELWPPTGAYQVFDLEAVAGVTDPNGLPFTIEITSITQDEPVNGAGDGDTVCDGTGVGTNVASIRAERQGSGNGRVYRVAYTATNSAGASCDGAIEFTVPRSSNGAAAVDDGQVYDSTEGC